MSHAQAPQKFLLTTLAVLWGSGAWAQTPPPAQPAPASSAPQAPAPATSSLSSSLGLYVFPAKNQTAQQQANDETSCFGWAKTQTGIDPMAIKPQAPDQQQAAAAADASTQGARVKGAARGAAAGAVIGGIAGDAGQGAAIGAAAGTMAGGSQKRQARRQAQEGASQQAQVSVEQQKATYNKAFSACMEGKGYTIK
jgi:YMGG-like Gly-zipper